MTDVPDWQRPQIIKTPDGIYLARRGRRQAEAVCAAAGPVRAWPVDAGHAGLHPAAGAAEARALVGSSVAATDLVEEAMSDPRWVIAEAIERKLRERHDLRQMRDLAMGGDRLP
jgi:hypothetical protein